MVDNSFTNNASENTTSDYTGFDITDEIEVDKDKVEIYGIKELVPVGTPITVPYLEIYRTNELEYVPYISPYNVGCSSSSDTDDSSSSGDSSESSDESTGSEVGSLDVSVSTGSNSSGGSGSGNGSYNRNGINGSLKSSSKKSLSLNKINSLSRMEALRLAKSGNYNAPTTALLWERAGTGMNILRR